MKVIKVISIMLILSVMFAMVGCADKIQSGTVYDKSFEAEHSVTTMMPMQCGNITVMIPNTFNYPDCYTIDIKNGEETARYEVTKEQYEKIKIGQTIKITEE